MLTCPDCAAVLDVPLAARRAARCRRADPSVDRTPRCAVTVDGRRRARTDDGGPARGARERRSPSAALRDRCVTWPAGIDPATLDAGRPRAGRRGRRGARRGLSACGAAGLPGLRRRRRCRGRPGRPARRPGRRRGARPARRRRRARRRLRLVGDRGAAALGRASAGLPRPRPQPGWCPMSDVFDRLVARATQRRAGARRAAAEPLRAQLHGYRGRLHSLPPMSTAAVPTTRLHGRARSSRRRANPQRRATPSPSDRGARAAARSRRLAAGTGAASTAARSAASSPAPRIVPSRHPPGRSSAPTPTRPETRPATAWPRPRTAPGPARLAPSTPRRGRGRDALWHWRRPLPRSAPTQPLPQNADPRRATRESLARNDSRDTDLAHHRTGDPSRRPPRAGTGRGRGPHRGGGGPPRRGRPRRPRPNSARRPHPPRDRARRGAGRRRGAPAHRPPRGPPRPPSRPPSSRRPAPPASRPGRARSTTRHTSTASGGGEGWADA